MGTYIVGALVLLAFAYAVYKTYKRRKGGGCSGCPHAGSCSDKC